MQRAHRHGNIIAGCWSSDEVGFHTESRLTLDKNDVEMTKILLNADADNSLQDHDGRTPTHLAAENGHADAIKALKEAGMDSNDNL